MSRINAVALAVKINQVTGRERAAVVVAVDVIALVVPFTITSSTMTATG